MTFVNTHGHSEYSLLDGLGSNAARAARAKEIGQTALTLTDHGNLCGALHHIRACEENGIKAIVGIEAYFRPNRLDQDDANYSHLILYAANMDGFRNLMALSSESYESGWFTRKRKPCVDWELLEKYNEGLLCTTSCLSGPVNKEILKGDLNEAMHVILRLRGIFGDRLWAEIQPHDIPEQRTCNMELWKLADAYDVALIAATDAHYPSLDWADTHDVLVMSRTGQSLKSREKARELGEDYMAFTGQTFYLMTEGEVREAFEKYHPELPGHVVDAAIKGTVDMSLCCDELQIDKSPKYPKAAETQEESEQILRVWLEESMVRIGRHEDEVYRDRMEYELSVMRDKGIIDYFVILGDLAREMKGRGCRVGPGRGSAAGSLVSYLARITSLDPIGHGLLFERFLNPDRMEPPDIDIDFSHTWKKDVKDYLAARWGRDHVADVAAFQTYGMKSALQAAAKVFDVDFGEVMSVTKNFGEVDAAQFGEDHEGEVGLKDVRTINSGLDKFATDHPEVWKHALRLEGQVKAMGRHPAGVVITDKPIAGYMPTMRSNGDERVTAWSERARWPIITEFGFLKIDALSTDSLTIQADAIRMIKERHGLVIDFEDLQQFPVNEDPHDVDPEVMKVFADGMTLGIFQFEGRGITGLLKEIGPDWLGDVTAANALFRPGPLEGGDTFAYGKRKRGQEKWKNLHPLLDPILDETLGIVAYQEQVMRVCTELGGLTPGQAGTIRKAMTKWHASKTHSRRGADRMTQFFDEMTAHAVALGMPKAKVEELWAKLVKFSQYGFNKSHADGYALQGYDDAWLKTYYPEEFYTSLLTWEPDKRKKVVREAINRGIKVLPPDVNDSDAGFTLVGDAIRFGITAIKDVGVTAAKELMAKRPFESYADLEERCIRVKVNSKVKSALMNVGAFDLWGMRDHMDEAQRADLERALLGFPLTGSGVGPYKKLFKGRVDSKEKVDMASGSKSIVQVAGEVVNARVFKTKKGTTMANLTIELDDVEHEVVVFGNKYPYFSELCVEGEVIFVLGEVNDKGEIFADDIRSAREVKRDVELAGRS